MVDPPERRRLGRGLEELLGASPTTVRDGELLSLSLDAIRPNAQQPRGSIDDDALAALAESIRANGLVQPVVVRAIAPGAYELIAGERRWRAARDAGLERIPAVVRDADEIGQLELALVENLAREDLNPIDVARACATLVEDFGRSHAELGQRLGRSRPAVSNLLRLLELPDDVQETLASGDLTEGHGRAILMADGARARRELAERALREGLSVRQTEALARARAPMSRRRPPRVAPPLAAEAIDAFTEVFDAPVRVRARRGGGLVVELRFADEQALGAALDRLGAERRPSGGA